MNHPQKNNLDDQYGKIINGRLISQKIINEIALEVNSFKQGKPGLVTILVGSNPSSLSYITLKNNIAKKIGFYQIQKNLPEDISESSLLEIIEEYNHDAKIHGILVQLPLPPHINIQKIVFAITPDKDVDCFHPLNQGNFFSHFTNQQMVACTPAGILEMLKRIPIVLEGKHVVIVGRSNLVGKPMLIMMLEKGIGANATVTITHSGTPDLSVYTKQADILIVAAGKAKLINSEMVKTGAVVIDVGVNRIGEKIGKQGGKIAILKGDVDFEKVKEKASYITPVPGGVGPMTIAMLMKNTLIAFKNIKKLK